ncbi:MAG: IgGFc-binding protein [Polyangiaceae bacterium]
MNLSVPVGAGGNESRTRSRALQLSRAAAQVALFLLFVASVSSACSATTEDDGFESTQSPSGAGQGGSGAESTTSGLGGSLGVGGSGIGGGGDSLGCSADLTQVIDANGVLVEQCPPDQGCAPPGICVPACEAAAASKGNVGCDFTTSTPHFYVGITPPCFAVFVANNWGKDAKLTISRAGSSYDVTQFGRIATADPNVAAWQPVPAAGVPPGEVAVLFLSHDPTSVNNQPLTCPVAPAIVGSGGTAVASTGRGQAWRLTSDVPVSMYDMLPYGGADSYLPSAELLLPTSAWGTNFIAVLPKDSAGPPWGHIVAHQDNTKVDIVPTVPLAAGSGVDPAPQNVKTTFTLAAGEYIQWQLTTEMTGSIIQSDKPIAFVGGNGYICYTSATSSGGGCDSAHQMIPPISAMGSEYVAPPYPTRRLDLTQESIPYRIVGTVDGTTLTYDPAIPNAPAVIGLGQRVDFEANVPFVVTSQDKDHPFYVGQLMTGCFVTGGNVSPCLGDEEYVNILPPAQFLSKYVFFTDPTYQTTNLSITRLKTAKGFSEVNVECLGNVTGWQPIGSSGEYEITWVDLVKFNVNVGACSNGPQVATSDGPFGIMVWGTDEAASYGYPAGGNVAPINTVVVPPDPK